MIVQLNGCADTLDRTVIQELSFVWKSALCLFILKVIYQDPQIQKWTSLLNSFQGWENGSLDKEDNLKWELYKLPGIFVLNCIIFLHLFVAFVCIDLKSCE